jgi:hypothetical protein
VRPLVTSQIVAATERFVTQRTRIVSRLIRSSVGTRVSLEILGVTESSLTYCAVILVGSDGIVDDFMVSGPGVSDSLSMGCQKSSRY